MSAILSLYNESLKSSESNLLRGVAPKKLYYCFYGRNAWHSTWIQRYTPDCMHLTLASAMAHAERKRVQGNVFYINELPALELDAGAFRVYITQINSNCPLQQYRSDAVRKNIRPDQKFIEGVRDNYLEIGASLEGAILSFNNDSRFWVAEQPLYNSVMVLYYSGDIPASSLKSSPLKAWGSNSVGKDYCLNWLDRDLGVPISGRSVLRIFKKSAFNISNHL